MLIRAIQELSTKNWSASVGLELQHIHTAWKEIGPVSLDQKEPLWEEFKAASAVLHEKRRIKFDEQKAQNGQRLEAKIAKIVEAEALRETGSQRLAHSIGIPLEFIEHSKRNEILEDLHITPANIVRQISGWIS